MSEEPYDDFSEEEGDRHMLGLPGEPNYANSSIGRDHLYEE